VRIEKHLSQGIQGEIKVVVGNTRAHSQSITGILVGYMKNVENETAYPVSIRKAPTPPIHLRIHQVYLHHQWSGSSYNVPNQDMPRKEPNDSAHSQSAKYEKNKALWAVSFDDKNKSRCNTSQYRRQSIRHQSCGYNFAWMVFANFVCNTCCKDVEKWLEIQYKTKSFEQVYVSSEYENLPLLQSSYSHSHPQIHFRQGYKPIEQ
jgi:hypothetical protein